MVEFDWGDGTSYESPLAKSGQRVCGTHSWSAPGDYEIRFKVVDADGAASGWSDPHAMTIAPGTAVLVEDFEDIIDVALMSGNGSNLTAKQEAGPSGMALQCSFTGGGGYWGLAKFSGALGFTDWSGFSGVQFLFRGGSSLSARLIVIEQGTTGATSEGEHWQYLFTPENEWTTVKAPFSQFVPRPEWQPATADGDGKLNIHSITSVQIAHYDVNASGTFGIDELALTRTASGAAQE